MSEEQSINRSKFLTLTTEIVVCLEDGKKLKMLKRHLLTSYGSSPEEYREKWGLAKAYPMVAPTYTRKRQELARKIGLGQKKPVEPASKPRRSRAESPA